MKKTLLLVFIHGFKGDDQTFHKFPQDLRALLSHALPKINILSIVYPRFETRGNLQESVARFKEWLSNKVIDLEVANHAPSPTLHPSVHVILCGHSMGGIVAAETLLSIARDDIIPPTYADQSTNSTTFANPSNNTGFDPPTNQTSSPSSNASPRLFFPHVRAILAFDTPYLGISPGVLAHGAEEQLQEASSAYKAYGAASKLFGWGTGSGTTAGSTTAAAGSDAAAAGAVSKSAAGAAGWGGSWGKYAMYGGAAAAVASVAGAAYLNWNQINEGLTWASSHLEFVGCLAKGAELQSRVERVVDLTRSHGVGFANFYGALHEKVTSKSRYAGMVLGQDRTFCVVPRTTLQALNRDQDDIRAETEMNAQMKQGKQVRDFARDPSRNKGTWVKCVNQNVTDEISSHVSMFASDTNPDYHAMVPRARDQIVEWIDSTWYEASTA